MEVHHETKLQSPKLGGLLTAQVRKRGTKQLSELSHKQASMVFNPSDPYSSAMDNIPLKDLFPNVKVRKRYQERKVEMSGTPPRSAESQDSTRNKLRESLTAALRTVGGVDFDQSPDQEWKAETQSGAHHYYTDERSRDQVPGAGQVKLEERGAETIDSVFAIPGRNSDLDWKYDINGSGFMGDGSWFPTNTITYPSHMEESPYKKLRVEAENLERDDLKRLQASHQAEIMALDIEAELFRHFGGVNRKYKEKARSLLFNLKDRSNPDLRTRVLSGEISPQNLCAMNAEQLASKELSQWRIAKAEEFAHMVVLTDADAEQRRLVKKTHKGEFEVQVEKDDVVAEVATGAVRQGFALGTKQETEENGLDIPAESIFDDDLDSIMAEADTEGLEFSPIRDPISIDSMSAADQVFDVNYDWDLDKDEKETPEVVAEPNLEVEMDKDDRLPAIMSLDEYLGSKKDRELKSAIKGEDVEIASGITGMKMHSFSHLTEMSYPSLTSSKERGPGKPTGSPKLKAPESGNTKNGSLFQKERKEHRKHEKLWEGSFQLSGSQISSVLAFYKSGDLVELQSWPKLVEIKGRVRLDALDKFLQELHLSRTRSIMVIACRVENGTSVNTMREAANLYEKGERVGYAEPAPGFELYLFPGGGASLKLLVEHGYLCANQILPEEEGILVGCVVCRRTLIPSSATHKTSSHYFNANRHALSGQLDSPTRPNEMQWTGRASPSSKTSSIPFADSSSGMPLKEFEDQKALKSFAITQSGVSAPNIKVEDLLTASTKSTPSSSQLMVPKPPGFDTVLSQSIQTIQDPRSGKFEAPPRWLQKDLNRDDDNSDDLPPGFGPKAIARVNPGIELSTVRDDDDDDDDLPEFDFATHSTLPNISNFVVKSSEVSRESTSPLTPSLGLQASSFPQGQVSPRIPQMPQTSARFSLQPVRTGHFEQLNPSGHPPFFSARPGLPPVHGSPGSVNSSQQSPQQIQQVQFHGLRPLPPPLPLSSQPLNIFPPRPHGSFVARPPTVAQIPGPGGLHAEQKETFRANFIPPSQNQPILPRAFGDPPRPDYLPSVFQEQRMRADFSGLPSLATGPHGQNTMTSMDSKHRSTMQPRNLWDDDDDMPEWCPPALLQEETRKVPLHPMPPLPPMEAERPGLLKEPSEQGMALRSTIPQVMGRGWQPMPSHFVPEMKRGPMQAEGRGILQAPGPALRYSDRRGVGILPTLRAEQFLAHRSIKLDGRSGEPREFKKVHQK